MRELAPRVEDRGIDEIYIDLSDRPGAQADAGLAAGRALKEAVHAATGLTCSIGIAPNKLLAKICSDLIKPDGLTLLSEAEIATRIWPLAVRKIDGVGPKAGAKLERLGIHSIGELAAANPKMLLTEFGINYGAWLHAAAHGRDERPIVTYREPKSISHETTFERDLHAVRDKVALGKLLTGLCVQLAEELARKGCASKNIGIKLRFDNFKIVTRDLTLRTHTMEARGIRHAAGACLKRVDLTRRLRLLGVRASALAKLSDLQISLATRSGNATVRFAKEPAVPSSLFLFD